MLEVTYNSCDIKDGFENIDSIFERWRGKKMTEGEFRALTQRGNADEVV